MTTFIGTNGNDTFHGDSSSDQVTFSGTANGYRIELVNGFVQVTDIDSSDGDTGVDTLTGIETLGFTDRSYTLQTDLERSNSGETLVNTYTSSTQYDSAVTGLADGGYVVTWSSFNQDGWSHGIYAQRYDASGQAVGGEIQVNTTIAYEQTQSAITALADGGYIVVWNSQYQDGSNYGIYAQRFDADGNAVGGETRINSNTIDAQQEPAITTLADGGYVISWSSGVQDGSGWGVYAQRYDANGATVGGETRINTYTSGNQTSSTVTALADGGYLVAWNSDWQDGSFFGIHAQRFDASGNMVGGEKLINTYTANDQRYPAIGALLDGGYVISWASFGQDGSNYGVYAQLFDSNGNKVGSETHVSSYTTEAQTFPVITTLTDGGYVIAWNSNGQDGSNYGVYAQRFDAGGNTIGGEVRINTTTASGQDFPSIAALADGGYVVSWSSFGQDGSFYGIYSQRFDAAGNPLASGLEITGTAFDDSINGGAGIQTLIGLAGNDTLDGGNGLDTLIGGDGNDTYVLGNADRIVERAGGGMDHVLAGFTYTLGNNLEILSLTGSSAINGTGNALDNLIGGNGASNTLYGLNGNDNLDGAGGNDRMIGGNGDDLYHVRETGDIVTETATGGTDTVYSYMSAYTLAANIENAIIITSAPGSLTGNGLNNNLSGNDGNDTLNGGLGNDTARYFTDASGYRIDSLADGRIQVVDINSVDGNTGTDVLTSIEQLDFNGTLYGLSRVTTGPVQGELRVNTTTSLDQYEPTLTALADGGYVIIWSSNGQDGSVFGIYAQRYGANGAAIGGETRINTTISGDQKAPAVTALADGGYVVTWDSFGQDGSGYGVYAQRYNAGGATVGGETRVSTHFDQDQLQSAITALANGGYVVTWMSWAQDGDAFGVYAQRYNANGVAVGAETRINAYTSSWQFDPAVTGLADGGYVITWASDGLDGSLDAVYAQRFDASGNTVGAQTLINSTTASYQRDPAITALADGGYVITWNSLGQDGSDYGIYAQRYNASGVAVGSEAQINTATTFSQREPVTAALNDGGYIIAWTSYAQDGSDWGIYAQRFNASGNAVGSETRINTYTVNGQSEAGITVLTDGGYVISWISGSQDGSGYGVYAQRFNADGSAWGPATLKITGTDGNDIINGGTGSQTIDGRDGNDTLNGLEDNDTLLGGTGKDSLMGHIGSDTLSGGSADDLVQGGAGSDILSGGNGNDTLNGNLGLDSLTGDAGLDNFLFNSTLNASSNIDTIVDFSVTGGDVIQLENAIFTKLLAAGALNAANFRASTAGDAVDADDFIVYDPDSGQLFYDADGSGAGAKIQFALIGTITHAALTAADFAVI